jgi:hypothetical protein
MALTYLREDEGPVFAFTRTWSNFCHIHRSFQFKHTHTHTLTHTHVPSCPSKSRRFILDSQAAYSIKMMGLYFVAAYSPVFSGVSVQASKDGVRHNLTFVLAALSLTACMVAGTTSAERLLTASPSMSMERRLATPSSHALMHAHRVTLSCMLTKRTS